MARTPGMLLPSSFDSDEEFKAALEAQGRAAGWTPNTSVKPFTPQEALAEAQKAREAGDGSS